MQQGNKHMPQENGKKSKELRNISEGSHELYKMHQSDVLLYVDFFAHAQGSSC